MTDSPTTRLAVQKALFNKAQIAVGPLGAAVYDSVPNDQPFPFVVFDLHQSLDNSAADLVGLTHNCFLSIWSTYRGRYEVERLLDALFHAFHERSLSLENGLSVLCRVSEQGSRLDADGLTHQGSLTLQILTNPF